MADNHVKVIVLGDKAIRDPLFWLGLILSKVSFGLIDTGRWRRYVEVE